MSAPGFIPDSEFVPDAPAQQAQAAPSQAPPGFIPDAEFQPDDDKYGTTGQTALGVGERVAKGVIGPGVEFAERGATALGIPGLTPEDQAGRAAALPTGVGPLSEAAGFAGSMLTGVGEGKLIGELGEGAAHLAGLGGESASTVSKIASSGIKTGAEMAALQGSDEISKAVNSDPNQTLGTAAINVGLSGLMGGAGGAVLGTISPLFKSSMESIGAPALIDDAKAQYDFRQSIPSGDVPAAISDELGTRLNEVDNLRDQMSNLKGESLARAMPEVTSENTAKIDTQIQDISSKMSQSIEKASDNAYLKGAVPKLTQDYQDFLQVVTDPNASYSDKFGAIDDLKRAQQAKSRYNLTAEDTALGSFTKGTARDLRLSLEDPKVWGDAANVQAKVNAAIKSSIDAEKDAVGKFTAKSNLEGGRVVDPNKVNSLVNQTLKGKAGLKTNAINNYLEHTQDLADTINKIHTAAGLDAPVRLTPTPALNHSLGRSSPGTTLGNWLYDKGLSSALGEAAGTGIGAGVGELAGHPLWGAAIGERVLSPIIKSVAKPLLEKATNSVALRGAVEYVNNVVKGGKVLNSAVESFFKSGAEIFPKSLIPDMASREKLEKSLEYAQNPQNLLNVGGNIGHYLPAHQTAAAAMSQTAVNYLQSLKPKQLQNSPLDKPTPIDRFAQTKYNRQLDIAQQPLLALKYAKQGTLQPQDVMTINTIYPGLAKKMVAQIQEEMINHISEKGTIPYKMRVSLSLLSGSPLDSTMTQPNMQAIMNANAPMSPPQSQAKPKKVSQSTAKTMEKTNSLYQTPDQARASGRTAGG